MRPIQYEKFISWLRSKHPDIRLTIPQSVVLQSFYTVLKAPNSGKSFLIHLLIEAEKDNYEA